MSAVQLDARCRCDADLAFSRLADFREYPRATETVLAVDVERDGDGRQVSAWEVQFRDGVLRWSEYDRVDSQARTIDFVQRDGDPASFQGAWRVDADEPGCKVSFAAIFDLGMPSFAAVVEPLAARTLLENMASVVHRLIDPDAVIEVSLDLVEP